uniref:Uncharacterized protein n=1 Tax=Anguilla anguilla TaxID=7936 RepID=A0A0E9SWM9_ANGAN
MFEEKKRNTNCPPSQETN